MSMNKNIRHIKLNLTLVMELASSDADEIAAYNRLRSDLILLYKLNMLGSNGDNNFVKRGLTGNIFSTVPIVLEIPLPINRATFNKGYLHDLDLLIGILLGESITKESSRTRFWAVSYE